MEIRKLLLGAKFVFALKIMAAIAFLVSGIICIQDDNHCSIEILESYGLLGAGLGIIFCTIISAIIFKYWRNFRTNESMIAAIYGGMIVLSLLCIIIGLIWINSNLGACLFGFGVAIAVCSLIICTFVIIIAGELRN